MRSIACLVLVASILVASCAPRVAGGCVIQPHSVCNGANLSGSDLERANLFGANLSEANLRGANLHQAYMRWSDLRGADLRESNLIEVDLRNALYDGDTLWPLGMDADGTGAMFVRR